jgi:hypothetical protein
MAHAIPLGDLRFKLPMAVCPCGGYMEETEVEDVDTGGRWTFMRCLDDPDHVSEAIPTRLYLRRARYNQFW